jgi:hypothetical protein
LAIGIGTCVLGGWLADTSAGDGGARRWRHNFQSVGFVKRYFTVAKPDWHGILCTDAHQ